MIGTGKQISEAFKKNFLKNDRKRQIVFDNGCRVRVELFLEQCRIKFPRGAV